MAHFVANQLKIRPNDILDTWGTAELIVAFGQYANERSMQNYDMWKQLGTSQRSQVPMPAKYAVYFEGDIEAEWQSSR